MAGAQGTDPPGGQAGELEDIFASLAAIERDLQQFQSVIKPAVTRIGSGLGSWSLNLGAGYQQAAEKLYAQVQSNLETQGQYSYQDLDDLKTVEQLRRKGGRMHSLGRAAATGGQWAAWAWEQYKQAGARRQILSVIAQEQERLPWVNDLIDRSAEHACRGWSREQRYLTGLAARVPPDRAARLRMEAQVAQTVDELRRLAEAESRLEYYREVSSRIARFRPEQFESGMQDLQAVGEETRSVYQLRGMRYLETVDEALCKLDWQSPYYRNGLPAGLVYFLNHGSAGLPEGVRLQAVDRAVQRLREETPPPSQVGEFVQAIRYLAWQVGNPWLLWWDPYRRFPLPTSLVLFLAALVLVTLVAAIATGIIALLY
jgi:hypothetical protein